MARGSRAGSSRMAPSTARSASRLWGGILPGSSTLVAMAGRAVGLLGRDRHRQRRRHVSVEADRHLEVAGRLDRLLELHASLLDRARMLVRRFSLVMFTSRSFSRTCSPTIWPS